jgi:hypothetical protein
MTDRHDTPRGPDDDELVRAALMTLMDDVGADPLPEPSAVRARAASSAPAPLTVLGSRAWSSFMGVDVTHTGVPGGATGQCFTTPGTDSWTRRTAETADGRVVAGQWVGVADGGGPAPTRAVDEAVSTCEGRYTVQAHIREELPGDAVLRTWELTDDRGQVYWWVEATRGSATSFLTLAEIDGASFTPADMRHLARAVLGEVDLTQEPRPAATSASVPTG